LLKTAVADVVTWAAGWYRPWVRELEQRKNGEFAGVRFAVLMYWPALLAVRKSEPFSSISIVVDTDVAYGLPDQ